MIDVTFFVGQQIAKQIAGHVVLDALTVGDGLNVVVAAVVLDLQIALEHLFDVFTDMQLAEILKVRDTFQKIECARSVLSACCISSMDSSYSPILAKYFLRAPPVFCTFFGRAKKKYWV